MWWYHVVVSCGGAMYGRSADSYIHNTMFKKIRGDDESHDS
jgi:hypothetical protein